MMIIDLGNKFKQKDFLSLVYNRDILMWKMGFLCIFFAEDKCGNWMSMIANWFSPSPPSAFDSVVNYTPIVSRRRNEFVIKDCCAMQARVQKV